LRQGQAGRRRRDPLRGPKGRPRHAGDAGPHHGAQGSGAGRPLCPGDRWPVFRRYRRCLDRPRHPEAAVGGPIALLRDGDIIDIDITAGKLSVRLSDQELATRREAWKPRPARFTSGWLARYAKMATSADTGAILQWGE